MDVLRSSLFVFRAMTHEERTTDNEQRQKRYRTSTVIVDPAVRGSGALGRLPDARTYSTPLRTCGLLSRSQAIVNARPSSRLMSLAGRLRERVVNRSTRAVHRSGPFFCDKSRYAVSKFIVKVPPGKPTVVEPDIHSAAAVV